MGAHGPRAPPQVPWIVAGSVRDNIVFGSAFEPARYERVVRGCALDVDIKGLPAGDATELGERGINVGAGPALPALRRVCHVPSFVLKCAAWVSGIGARH